MKKIRSNLIILIILLASLVSCDKDEHHPSNDEDVQIQFLKSALGGCNNKSENNMEFGEEKNDTVLIGLVNDTLNIHAGINYICCTPFVTECNITGDSIFITITDTCSNPYHDCYCRCDCYYTFDYFFEDVTDKKYYYKITLRKTAEESDIKYSEGFIDIGIQMNNSF